MLGFTVAAAGLAAYLLALAVVGYYCGEAPDRLLHLFARLQGQHTAAQAPSATGQSNRLYNLTLALVAGAVLFMCGMLLTRSLIVAALLSAGGPIYPITVAKTLRHRRRSMMTSQFGLALQAISATLRASGSLHTAISRAAADLDRLLAGQPFKPMVTELEVVNRDLALNMSLEEALIRLRGRTNLEDVTDFVGAVCQCRIAGGNAVEVIDRIARIIEDKIQVQQQILTLTSGKRMESTLISVAPPVFVGLLALMSPDYLKPMYSELVGQILAGLGLALLLASYIISRRVLQIEL